jgi:hypothetical protein
MISVTEIRLLRGRSGGLGFVEDKSFGAALIEVIRNSLGLLGINAFWQGAFIGGATILAVLFDRMRNFRQSEYADRNGTFDLDCAQTGAADSFVAKISFAAERLGRISDA